MDFAPPHADAYLGPAWYLLLLQAAGILAILFVLLWLVSLWKRDVSIVDIAWGPAFLVAAAWYHWATRELPRPQSAPDFRLVYLGLVALWALRLALHIGWRHQGEDYRYRTMREKTGPSFAWRSVYRVFLLQAALVVVISVPHLFLQMDRASRLLPTDYLAFALFAVGFFFEAVGDWQLQRFRADRSNKGKVLRTGLWAYSRHPNYFGEAVIWVAFYFGAWASPGLLPKIVSLPPVLLMIFLLLKVSGVSLLEKTIGDRRPEYRDYIATTPAFFPWFPKRRATGEAG